MLELLVLYRFQVYVDETAAQDYESTFIYHDLEQTSLSLAPLKKFGSTVTFSSLNGTTKVAMTGSWSL